MSLAERVVESQPRKFGLWPSVWKLLRLRVRIWWNVFRRSKLRNKIGTIIVALLVLGGMGFLFFLSTLLLRFLQSPQLAEMVDPAALIQSMPTLVLTAAFFATILTNFGVLLQALYLSRDMDFLVTRPLPMRAVFLAKLLEAILPNFALFCAFSLPVLFGLGTASRYNILYYPLLVILLALLTLAAGGLASILVMAVVRVVPARRVAEVLGFLGAMVSILCGQSGNLMSALWPGEEELTGMLGMFSRMDMPWSPLSWAGRGLNQIGQGDWLPGIALTALSLALAGAIFGGTLLLAERLYYTGWSSMQGTARKKRPAAKPAAGPLRAAGTSLAAGASPAAGARLAGLLPRPIRGIVVKDLLLLRRDPRNFSQLLTPLIVGFVMLFSTRGGGRNATAAMVDLGLRDLEVYGILVLAIFVGWMLMFSLSTLAFSREGRSYWFLKASPVRPMHLLAGKYIVSYLPAAAFCLVYLVLAFVIRGLAPVHFPYAALIVLLVMAGASGISLAYGVAGANFDWDSPRRQRLTGWTGCFSVLAVLGFLALDLALFLLPPGLWQVFTGETPFYAYLIGIALGGLAAGLCVYFPLRMVAGRLQRIGEAGS